MIRCLLTGLVLCFIFSCEEPDLVGSAVLPATDQPGLFFTDTSSVICRTVSEDSLISNLYGFYSGLPTLLLGSINDASIGRTDASFYVEVRLGSSLINGFDSILTLDSVILSLGYQSNYGDTNSLHRISVFELAEAVPDNKFFYTTQDLNLKPDGLLGSKNLVPKLKDSIQVGSSKQPAHLRIKLDNELGVRFMQKSLGYPLTFTSNNNFLRYFKGIYVSDDASGDNKGSILSLDPASSLNSLTIYYTKTTDSVAVSKSYSFLINLNSGHSVRTKHNYIPAIFDTVLPQTLFVQSAGGLKTKLQFPNLMNLSSSHAVGINKASIVVKLKTGTNTSLSNHTSLLIYASDSLGNNVLIPDAEEPANPIGGAFSTDQYVFNISRYMQQVLSGKLTNNGMFIVATGRLSNAQRTLLNGSSVQLKLTYTLQNK